jgi:hypothetical protein
MMSSEQVKMITTEIHTNIDRNKIIELQNLTTGGVDTAKMRKDMETVIEKRRM